MRERFGQERNLIRSQLNKYGNRKSDAAWSEVFGLIGRLGDWTVMNYDEEVTEHELGAGSSRLVVVSSESHSPGLEALAAFLGAKYQRGDGFEGNGPPDSPIEWEAFYDEETWRYTCVTKTMRVRPASFTLLTDDIVKTRDMLRIQAGCQWQQTPTSAKVRLRRLIKSVRRSSWIGSWYLTRYIQSKLGRYIV